LPAPVAALPSPNPCPVTAFAEKQRRKCRAQAAGSATWERYMNMQSKDLSGHPWPLKSSEFEIV